MLASPVDDGSFGEGRTRPRPQQLAAQIARYRLEELARDPCCLAVSKSRGMVEHCLNNFICTCARDQIHVFKI